MQKCPGAARRIAVLLSGLVAAGLPIPGFTQSLEELVVTARKQEENLQEVPISVTAFSAAQLQNMGVNNNEEGAFMTVNFNNLSQIGRRLDRPGRGTARRDGPHATTLAGRGRAVLPIALGAGGPPPPP